MNVKSRGISLTEEDADTFRRYGFGALSAGVRRAANLVRSQKETL